MAIQYYVNKPVSCTQYIQLLRTTSLGARRPVDDEVCIQGMLDNANLLVSAWVDDILVGVARSVTDFHFCCYVSDLAVSEHVQASGIGKALLRETFNALQPGCKIILLAAPQAVDYYPKIGFTRHDSAWVMDNVAQLR